jgi:predicted AAA+ superfamily ATPase
VGSLSLGSTARERSSGLKRFSTRTSGRKRIRDVEQFRVVFDFVLFNYSNPLTWNSMKRLLKGVGVDVDVKTIMNYVEYMRRAFLNIHRKEI